MKKLLSILLVPFICFILVGNVFATGNEASVSVDLPVSNQSFKPGANVQISGKAQNINQVTVLVRNAGGGIAYATQPTVSNATFSTEFQLNDDAIEGQYSIRIGAKELTAPVDSTFTVSKGSNAGILEVWPAAEGYELHLRGVGDGSIASYYARVYQGEAPYTTGETSGEVLVEFQKQEYLDSFEYVSQVLSQAFPVGQYEMKFYSDTDRTDLAFNYPFNIDPMIHITNPPLHGSSTIEQLDITGYISNFSSATVDSLQYKLNAGDWQDVSLNESGNFSIPVTLESGNNTFALQMQYSSAQTSSITHNIAGEVTFNLDECFIATACFGSKYEPGVVLLRQFRDDYLMKTNWGQAFVSCYYQNSPPIAAQIAGSSGLKGLTRVLLIPVISIVYLLYHPLLATAVVLLILMLAMYKHRRKILYS